MPPKIRIDEASLWKNLEASKKWRRLQELQDQHYEIKCQTDPYLYIDNPYKVSEDQAEELCYKCPLIKDCYEFAIANDEQYGIWGGVNFTSNAHIEEMF